MTFNSVLRRDKVTTKIKLFKKKLLGIKLGDG